MLVAVERDVAHHAVELDQLAVFEAGDQPPELGRLGEEARAASRERQAAGDDHRRELARSALAVEVDDVAVAQILRQRLLELAW